MKQRNLLKAIYIVATIALLIVNFLIDFYFSPCPFLWTAKLSYLGSVVGVVIGFILK